MPVLQEEDTLVDFCNISPELSRPFRGLRAWLPIKMHGIGAFRDVLDEKLDLIHWFSDELAGVGGIEIVAKPQLTVLAFRCVRPGWSLEQSNEATRRLLQAINRRGHVYLNGTMLEDRYVIRVCILNFRTHRDRMEACLDDISAGLAEIGDNL